MTFSFKEMLIITGVVSLTMSSIVGFLVYVINGNRNLFKVESSYNKIKNEYIGKINKEELEDAAIDGMMKYLNEKYSLYMNEEATEDLDNKLDGNYEGIGIEIILKDGALYINKVYKNTPAYEAGVKENDQIIKIDEETIGTNPNLEELANLIKSKNKVAISVKRDKEILNYTIAVKKIDKPVVTEKTFNRNNKKIGYIYLSSFTDTAYEQVKSSLTHFDEEKIDALIFDVRSNTGGYLKSVTDILNLFIKKGHILYSLEEKSGNKTYYDTTKEEYDKNIVVLIDRKTASASEILATSLKESYGAIIVGTTSYGKGKVQSTYRLSKNKMLKYTTAKWYTPLGNSIDEVGITPGVYVSLDKKYVLNPCDDTDTQLQKALEILTQ